MQERHIQNRPMYSGKNTYLYIGKEISGKKYRPSPPDAPKET